MALMESFRNSVTNEVVSCKLAGICSGCAWIERPYSEQLDLKLFEIRQILATLNCTVEPKLHTVGSRAGRSRLDLTLENQDGVSRLGLYGLNQQGIADMLACPMATEALENWLAGFRRETLPLIRKGSIRLRISPSGQRGLWIDFANEDIKKILDEGEWLEKMADQAVVEIGQRNKRLTQKEGRWKLGEPEIAPWFETYLGTDLKAHPIYIPISGFTQTGFGANRLLVKTAMELLEALGPKEVLELFCGSGNFSLAMASRNFKVTAIELDSFALEGLSRSLKEASLEDQVVVKRKDLYRIPKEELKSPVWFVDPPRSGLKSVVDRLGELSLPDRPEHFIYVSCFLKSWAEDALRLQALGYKLKRIEGVDQFPNTPHCEWISYFSL